MRRNQSSAQNVKESVNQALVLLDGAQEVVHPQAQSSMEYEPWCKVTA
jgi:hypothetical protein